MVSIGRTYRAWVLVAALGLAPSLSLGAAPVQPASKPKGATETAKPNPKPKPDSQNGLTAHDRESLTVDREANRIAERANLIAEAQRAYAFWQLVLGGFGVVFTGIAAFFAYRATHWAKAAAAQAGRSADADNKALELNQTALKEQREAMRPYMVFTSGKFSAECGEHPETEIVIKFKNTGSVPAFIKGQVLYQWNTTLIDGNGNRTDAGSWSEFAVDIMAPGSEHELSSGRGFPGCKFVASGGIIVGVRLQYGAFGMFWDETTWLEANWNKPNDAGEFRPNAPPDENMRFVVDTAIPSLETKGLKRGV